MTTKITVNEKVYDSVEAMPPDVRAIYEQAMRTASAAGPAVKHSEIKVMFQMGGSAPKFWTRPGSAAGGETPAPPIALVEHGSPSQANLVDELRPIEPASGAIGAQVLLVVAVGLAIGLAFWFWASH
jgi:hypothetical protein